MDKFDITKHTDLLSAAIQGNSDIIIANETARRVQARAKKEGVDKIPFRWFREERDKMFGNMEGLPNGYNRI